MEKQGLHIDFKVAKQAFESYLDEYDREDDKIQLKIVHTYGGYFVLERSRAFFIFYVSERERGKRAVLSALRNFAGSRCLVLGNRAFL